MKNFLVCFSEAQKFVAITGLIFAALCCIIPFVGILAQLGEHYTHIVGVTGSSPVSPTKNPLEPLFQGVFILRFNGLRHMLLIAP